MNFSYTNPASVAEGLAGEVAFHGAENVTKKSLHRWASHIGPLIRLERYNRGLKYAFAFAGHPRILCIKLSLATLPHATPNLFACKRWLTTLITLPEDQVCACSTGRKF
jgi:hypothetical protein